LTRTELRRIYLRKLKSHPPEKDPDGFRELREAFELVRERVREDAAPRPAPIVPVILDASEHSEPKAAVFSPPDSAEASSPSPPPIAPPVAADPPRSQLPPLAPRTAEPPLPLAALVTKLLDMLAAGLVDGARGLERDWRAKPIADDHRQATELVAARWSLLRELLGVATELPVPVTKLLAKALAEGDLAGARLSLIVYGREHPIEAELAADALAKRAPNIFKPIENTLFVPRPKPVPTMPIGGVFGYGLDFMRAMADKNKRR
jgi:hypothetical protein